MLHTLKTLSSLHLAYFLVICLSLNENSSHAFIEIHLFTQNSLNLTQLKICLKEMQTPSLMPEMVSLSVSSNFPPGFITQ